MIKKYYSVPLDYLPFKEISSLENTSVKVGYMSFLPLNEKGNDDLYLASIYDNFNEKATIEELKQSTFLCGQVLAEPSVSRGKVKHILIGSEEVELEDKDYPDMKYSNVLHLNADDSSGNWFYTEKGEYYVFRAKKSEFAKVRHLEDMVMHTDLTLRLRIVIELLKRNVRNGVISLTEDDYKKIAVLALKADPLFRAKDKESAARNVVTLHLPLMLSVPVWEDIPKQLRGKALR